MTLAVKTALSKLATTSLFEKELYFIGGTALAYHLNHRISEDVDVISPSKLSYRIIESTMLSLGAIKQKDIHESALRINGLNPSEYMLKFLLDDEIVYLNEESPVAISFENLQKRLIEKINLMK